MAPVHMSDAQTIASERQRGRDLLAGFSTTAGLDSDVLLGHVTGLSRAELIAHGQDSIGDGVTGQFRAAVERRRNGEPVAYITGVRSFRTLELTVDERVLIPRPETELLVDVGLFALRSLPGRRRLIDVGVGSGAVALSIAVEIPDNLHSEVEICGVDRCSPALTVARENCLRLGLDDRVALFESDLLDAADGWFDVILANLPYLRDDQRHPTTAAEPDSALYGGADGLGLYQRFVPQAAQQMTAQGIVACEIDPQQNVAMAELVATYITGEVIVLPDLAGRDRIVVGGAVDIVRTVADTWPYDS